MAATLLTLRDVVVRYGDAVALDIAALDLYAGQVLALVGPNGSGKSTLLRVMGLLQRPLSGSVEFGGENALDGNLLRLRRRIATVFQEPLLLNATLFDNAGLGLKLRGLSRRDIERRLTPWLERLGIAHLRARSARSLSGGEAQRTSLARALALEPDILLLDEPFAALDPSSREALLRDFESIVRANKITAVFVTHHREEAFGFAERVGVMHRGRLLQIGARDDVFRRPASETVAEIVGIENLLTGVVENCGEDSATIRVNQSRLQIAGRFTTGTQVIFCLRPEEIMICRDACARGDINRLAGRVAGVSIGVLHQRIVLDCDGVRLVVFVGRGSGAPELAENDRVTATFGPGVGHVIVRR